MSLFYHIRNALAHGRIAMYPAKGNDITFVMEDGQEKGKEFRVSARIVINKSSLLNVIELLKNPPIENDYSEDILSDLETPAFGYEKKMVIVKKEESWIRLE